MSTHRIRDLYEDHLPANLKEDLALLAKLENNITQAEGRLAGLRKDRDTLLAKLEPYRKSSTRPATNDHTVEQSSVFTSEAAINRLPNELLATILEYYPVHYHQYEDVGKWLFVSKRWYQVVSNTPTLWLQVSIRWAGALLFSERHRYLSRISSSMKYSRGVPLDVYLDLFSLQSKEEYISEQVIEYASQLVESEDMSHLRSVLSKAHEKSRCIHYEIVLRNTADCLFGINSRNLEQWKTLYLSWPHSLEASTFVLQKLGHKMPQLKELTMEHWPTGAEGRIILHQLRIEAPALTILRWRSETPTPLSGFIINPSLITQLELTISRPDIPRYLISEFSHLVLLRMRGAVLTSERPNYERYPIFLPRLQKLVMLGMFKTFQHWVFKLPSLDELTVIQNQWSFREFRHLSGLNPRIIDWPMAAYEIDDDGNSETEEEMSERALHLISLSNRLESLTIDSWQRGLLSRSSDRCTSNKSYPGRSPILL